MYEIIILYVCISYCSYWFLIGDHCSCFSDDRFQLNTAIFKSDGSEYYCTYYARSGRNI